MSQVGACAISLTFYFKKLFALVLLSYINNWEFLRTLKKIETRASLCTSLVFLKSPVRLYNSTMHLGAYFFISSLQAIGKNVRWQKSTREFSN